MNTLEPPSTETARFGRPSDPLEAVLRAFFEAEMPRPWPEMPATLPFRETQPARRPRLNRSRLVLAASVALLLIGQWFLLGNFDPEPTGGRGPHQDVAKKNKLLLKESIFQENGKPTTYKIDVYERE